MVVELERFGLAGRVELAQFARPEELLGEEDGEPEDFVEHRGEEGVVVVGRLGELPKELLIYLRRGHQQRKARRTSEALGARHGC